MNSLNNLKKGEISKIISIDNNLKIKKRLLDIGLNNNEKIECVLINPSNNMKAYKIKNTVIALRNTDSKYIKIGDMNE